MRREETAVSTDSIVDDQPNTSPLDILTAEQSSDEMCMVPDQLKGLDVHHYQSC